MEELGLIGLTNVYFFVLNKGRYTSPSHVSGVVETSEHKGCQEVGHRGVPRELSGGETAQRVPSILRQGRLLKELRRESATFYARRLYTIRYIYFINGSPFDTTAHYWADINETEAQVKASLMRSLQLREEPLI